MVENETRLGFERSLLHLRVDFASLLAFYLEGLEIQRNRFVDETGPSTILGDRKSVPRLSATRLSFVREI